MKNERHLERIMKGVANHRRIAILRMLEREPELSVEDISARFDISMKTVSEHVRRLAIAGLVMKRNAGRWVRHKLTDRGQDILTFLRTLE